MKAAALASSSSGGDNGAGVDEGVAQQLWAHAYDTTLAAEEFGKAYTCALMCRPDHRRHAVLEVHNRALAKGLKYAEGLIDSVDSFLRAGGKHGSLAHISRVVEDLLLDVWEQLTRASATDTAVSVSLSVLSRILSVLGRSSDIPIAYLIAATRQEVALQQLVSQWPGAKPPDHVHYKAIWQRRTPWEAFPSQLMEAVRAGVSSMPPMATMAGGDYVQDAVFSVVKMQKDMMQRALEAWMESLPSTDPARHDSVPPVPFPQSFLQMPLSAPRHTRPPAAEANVEMTDAQQDQQQQQPASGGGEETSLDGIEVPSCVLVDGAMLHRLFMLAECRCIVLERKHHPDWPLPHSPLQIARKLAASGCNPHLNAALVLCDSFAIDRMEVLKVLAVEAADRIAGAQTGRSVDVAMDNLTTATDRMVCGPTHLMHAAHDVAVLLFWFLKTFECQPNPLRTWGAGGYTDHQHVAAFIRHVVRLYKVRDDADTPPAAGGGGLHCGTLLQVLMNFGLLQDAVEVVESRLHVPQLDVLAHHTITHMIPPLDQKGFGGVGGAIPIPLLGQLRACVQRERAIEAEMGSRPASRDYFRRLLDRLNDCEEAYWTAREEYEQVRVLHNAPLFEQIKNTEQLQ